jgi:ATP-dependent exoDNAse (exonuclease V) beta subunit
MIYDKFFQIAGSIDMVFQREDGKYEIFDWKRSKEIKLKNGYQKCFH